MPVFQRMHRLVPQEQVSVPQVLAIAQAPLPPRVLVAVTISRPREINPLGMSELVSHEIQPRFA
jgi:hypothetical protein